MHSDILFLAFVVPVFSFLRKLLFSLKSNSIFHIIRIAISATHALLPTNWSEISEEAGNKRFFAFFFHYTN
jgi:hypothetical protein